ncbi:hypothetical protein PIROE2DRAFT_16098 [Piromyces sp. E2]|nr:hypothetical protein PIROE2DRAFT_16098 [Piromyces sp. E2]|eukprot:OUM58572.1 hypothetical protein PIROE2DRAFT_16098 [Piromyces sp. E2]
MVLTHSHISVELSLPEELYDNLLIKESNNQNIYFTNRNNNQFKIDILIPNNYKKGNNTCLFIHGSGSSKLSSRNKYVANGLLDMNICCCLMNLFTTTEEEIDKKTCENRFNIGKLLTSRVLTVIDFLLNINQLYQRKQLVNFIRSENTINNKEELRNVILS